MRAERGAARLLQAFVIVFCSVSLLDHHLKPLGLAADGAVVRPTIFSDLAPDAPAGGGQSGQQPAGPQQQQQQQQPAPQANLPVSAGQYLNSHWQQQQPAQQQSDGAQTQKINPLKSRFCAGPGGQRAERALGLQSGAVDDLSLSASSASNEQVGPHLARLNQNSLGGAWCPMKPISAGTFGQEWLQVKLNRSFVVSAVETQGRFALGSGKEFVPSYQIVYSRNGGLTWHKWKDFRGSSLLRANEDVNTGVRNELSPPIVGANVIRILPFSQYLRTVCLRLELHGCPYDEGAPVSYTASDGVVEPRWGHLIDYTYDGLRHRSGQLSGGLGQLVDGVKGPDNFSFNSGFEWVGWKSMNGDVVIEFTFKTLRNFTGALFHSNNLFSSGVEVFQAVDVHYGVDIGLSTEALRDALHERRRRQQPAGDALARSARQSAPEQPEPAGPPATVWSADVLSIEYEPDKKAESSRPVTVHLKQRLANKLRFVLKFASKWILLSEVEFLSHPVELMSLASLSEQLTPQLMAELKPAKTYDQYVAILREHQLRRIAADEFTLNMGGALAGPAASSTTTAGPLSGAGEQLGEQADQESELQRPAESPAYDTAESAGARRPFHTSAWPAADQSLAGGPATNPLLASQPPLYPPATGFGPAGFPEQPGASLDKTPAEQPQQRTRTLGLATVVSFVLVGLLVVLGALFAVSSYRLRCRSPKLGPPSALPRHLQQGGAGGAGRAKGFIGSVFASAGSSASSADSNSIGSLHHSQYQRHHMVLGGPQAAYQQHLHDQLRAGDSHYNPLFATASGRSSEGSLRKPAGPLSTLKKLAALTTGAPAAKQELLFGQPSLQQQQQQQQQQNQLLVSLKDSISSGGKCKSAGKSQAVSTQLIVGLNQANPLAHQQIYHQHAQPIYGQPPANQSNPYSSTANSMSLTSSSTLNGAAAGAGLGQPGEYSLAAGTDYATPDLQPVVQAGQQFHHPLMGAPRPAAFAAGDAFARGSTRRGLQHGRLAGPSQLEHNYEQINGELPPGELRFGAAANTLHHHHHHNNHQRTLSGNQQQQLVCGQQQAFNSMTLAGGAFAGRAPRQQQQQPAEPSHYYYADTDAAKAGIGK